MIKNQNQRREIAKGFRNLFAKLWNDETGFIVSLELILVATILVIGLIAGLTAVRDAVVSELSDAAQSIQAINQSFAIQGTDSQTATTSGSSFEDRSDVPASVCIVVFGQPES